MVESKCEELTSQPLNIRLVYVGILKLLSAYLPNIWSWLPA